MHNGKISQEKVVKAMKKLPPFEFKGDSFTGFGIVPLTERSVQAAIPAFNGFGVAFASKLMLKIQNKAII